MRMEAIRRQASKLREQVAKQQQAVLKQLGHISGEGFTVDEDELRCHRQLQDLYNSTRAAKHLQRNIVRGVDGFVSVSSKQMEIVRKLADDCCDYALENQSTGSSLSRAAVCFGTAHRSMETERETLLEVLLTQVSEPLRASISGAPLEDARHLTRRYDKMRQELENQAAEVLRRRSKSKDPAHSAESAVRLKTAETRYDELKSAMMALGREATVAMSSVEDQQQQITFQRLLKTHYVTRDSIPCSGNSSTPGAGGSVMPSLARKEELFLKIIGDPDFLIDLGLVALINALRPFRVNAERSYHRRVLAYLEKLHAEMILEEQLNEPTFASMSMEPDGTSPSDRDDSRPVKSNDPQHGRHDSYFIAKVIHPFDAQADGELSLSVDDYVIVRQVAPNGWSEGECNERAGWFPSAYVEHQDKAPSGKIQDTPSGN